MAAGADIQKAMSDMGRHAGFTVRIDPAVQGNVTVDNAAGSIETFLDEAMTQTRAIWWYDGVILYVEPKEGLSSALMVSQGLSLVALRKEMEALDLFDDRFPITATGDGAVIRIVGPQGYIKQVQNLADTLITSRRARTGTPEEAGLYIPRVFHGRALQ